MSNRDLSNLPVDTAAVHGLLQSAVTLELATIPLYMSALYSIKGFYPAPSNGPFLWPGVRPNPTSAEPNQLAFNSIFSVYVQEMEHLQLAANLATAVGLTPKFELIDYTGTTIPCLGDLTQVPGFEDVKVKIGPLDMNQIKLFMAIELPDRDADADKHPQPVVPFATKPDGSPDVPTTFGAIGHIYHCIGQYFDLEYTDGKTLWEKLYDKDSVQVDMFNFKNKNHPAAEYPEFPVSFEVGLSASEARDVAQTIMTAIIDQGEGAEAGNDVPNRFVPADEAMANDYGQDNADVRSFWDQLSHYERFSQVASLLDKVETWPQWWAARGGINPWKPEDLLTAPDAADKDQLASAAARARALNDLNTAGQLNDALNHSYNNLLGAIANAWSDESVKFPFPAMKAMYTRVCAIWASGGVPEFKNVKAKVIAPDEGHACQGLDPSNPGKNSCANAVPHTCAGSNSCKHQGGCGYPSPGILPDNNSAAGDGGCGAPIPEAQVLSNASSAKVNGHTVDGAVGDSVYETAWKVFAARNNLGSDVKAPAPNNLRLVLPPS